MIAFALVLVQSGSIFKVWAEQDYLTKENLMNNGVIVIENPMVAFAGAILLKKVYMVHKAKSNASTFIRKSVSAACMQTSGTIGPTCKGIRKNIFGKIRAFFYLRFNVFGYYVSCLRFN